MQNINNDIIVIKKRKVIYFVSTHEIIACEANDNTTKVYLLNGEIIVATKCLKYFEAILLRRDFVKISRSVVVAVCQIRSVKSKTVQLVNGISFKLLVNQNLIVESITTKSKT